MEQNLQLQREAQSAEQSTQIEEGKETEKKEDNNNNNNSGGDGGEPKQIQPKEQKQEQQNSNLGDQAITGINNEVRGMELLNQWSAILQNTQNLPSLTEQLLLGPTETQHLSTMIEFKPDEINKNLEDGDKLTEGEITNIKNALGQLKAPEGQPPVNLSSGEIPLWALEQLGADLLKQGKIKESNFLLKVYQQNMNNKAKKSKIGAYVLSFLSYGMMIAGFVAFFVSGTWTIALTLIGIGFGVKQIINIFQKLYDRSKTKNEKKIGDQIKNTINSIKKQKINNKNDLENFCKQQISNADKLAQNNIALKKDFEKKITEKDKDKEKALEKQKEDIHKEYDKKTAEITNNYEKTIENINTKNNKQIENIKNQTKEDKQQINEEFKKQTAQHYEDKIAIMQYYNDKLIDLRKDLKTIKDVNKDLDGININPEIITIENKENIKNQIEQYNSKIQNKKQKLDELQGLYENKIKSLPKNKLTNKEDINNQINAILHSQQ